MIDHNKLKLIGYDRMVFDVGLESIDLNRMGHLKSGISYAGAGDHIYTEILDVSSGSFKKIKSLNIVFTTAGAVRIGGALEKDSVKYGLKIKQNNNNLTGGVFTSIQLDLVAGRVAYGTNHNVYNLNDPEMMLETLERVRDELKIYGINLMDPETWSVFNAEVNMTVAAAKPMADYDRSLLWMFNELFHSEKYLEKHNIERKLKDCSITHTYKCNARGESVKIYDKSGQIRDTLNTIIPENLIRLEFTWNREKLKRIFKTDNVTVKDLQRTDLLQQRYDKALGEIIDILQQGINRDISRIEKLFKKDGYKELDRVLKRSMDVLDIIFLYRAAQIVYRKYKNGHLKKDIKKLHDDIQSTKKHNYRDLIYILAAFKGVDVEFFKVNKTLKEFL